MSNNISTKKHRYLNKLKITFIIPSHLKNSSGFITMFILFEKNINSKPIFLIAPFSNHITLLQNNFIFNW